MLAHPAPQGVLAAARQRRRVQRLAAAEEGQQQQQQQDDWSIGLAGGRQQHQRPDVHVVLVHPCIPQNAGNVARTCAATNVGLHLVGPLGFELDSKKLKRAGLDYWNSVCVDVHPSWDAFYEYWQQQPGPKQLVGYSKFAKHHYAAEGLYPPGTSTWLMLGAETTGLPPEAHAAATQLVKIPMANFQFVRSLNLATSAGIGVMEVLRQKDGAVLPEDAAAPAAADAAA
ncbi:S-adenosyl-L-methionine dependent tRNA rRNA methyltransferase [Chlorella sorokiniana]|uniref:S-adenosyl-L-methionine dependent tRNA rRNA methyltransferase n=1 Tax=Chlorella sorokiniana TaxID=3076 RepID=A0A2P6TQY2_CHLSO|nr:S-adenosyl-L-methionine dependent tRNA rRNA methyltransferase [Chlorella sorokiniana]|eukprot:PRW56467.1 S-adenosyl-L-methionine dependent tRNA rRNA methyltransferase [Chlorella sorokiniana]